MMKQFSHKLLSVIECVAIALGKSLMRKIFREHFVSTRMHLITETLYQQKHELNSVN